MVGPFCEIVKLRNRLAKLCGAEDFYDYTVKQAEGFSKRCAAKMYGTIDSLQPEASPHVSRRHACRRGRLVCNQ